MLKSGEILAGYRIESRLGTGGMGVVYEATQLSLDRTVALKVLAPNLSADEAFRERFRREAMLQAALEHPYIVTVHETGESDEGLFIATRLVRGRNLRQLIDAGLEPERALGILEQVASALDAAHAAGLVHRDVKPQNILVDEARNAFLADFGLVRGTGSRGPTRTGEYLGSLDYVAPEQIRGEPVTVASDLYAFAAVLYEALSAEVPFPRDTEAALLYAHLSEPAPRLTERRAELPPALDAVVARGLAKDPAGRFTTAGELVAAAQAALVSGDGARRPRGETIVDPGLLRRAPVIPLEPERKRIWPWVVAIVAGAVLLALIGFAVGRSGGDGGTLVTAPAVAGPLSLDFPAEDWRSVSRPATIPGLALSDVVGLASRRSNSPGSLVAGTGSSAEGPRLLPQAFLALLERNPVREAVRLGSYDAFRYRHLRNRRLKLALNLYAVPTDHGVVTIGCMAPKPDSPALARCEAVATTLKLRGVQAQPLGPDSRYAVALDTALATLGAARESGRRALREARSPGAQARAADELEAAFRSASVGLERTRPGPLEAPLHRTILAAMARAADGYADLAAAARDGRPLAYDRAAARVGRAEEALDDAVVALHRLGYRIHSG